MIDTTVGQRFIQLISHLGISKNAFAASLDKTATVVQHLVDERNKPGFDLLCKVFEVYPNVSKAWLLQGQGPMLTDASASGEAGATQNAGQPQASERGEDPAAVAKSAAKGGAHALPVGNPVVPVSPAAAAEPAPAATRTEAAVAAVFSAPTAAVPAQAEVLPQVPAAASVTPSTGQESLQAALYAQQLAHQLTVAEMRNQHLLEQQRMMQQMLDLMQRQLAR
ncbi:hypothetical protein GCM10022408_01470 [Hymenobacter fastidiosus]|uniref:XRE family transcriptional regulator n=1 Tax=Hymenobacter fastidiosus TaxID=486264 RepID=A0ABP7RBH2_9BACT